MASPDGKAPHLYARVDELILDFVLISHFDSKELLALSVPVIVASLSCVDISCAPPSRRNHGVGVF
jgi:hypothetical protein